MVTGDKDPATADSVPLETGRGFARSRRGPTSKEETCENDPKFGGHVRLSAAQGHGWGSERCLIPQEKSSGRTAHYKLTSTVMLWLQTNKSGSGTMNLGGSLTRQVGWPVPAPDGGPGPASVSDRVSPPEMQRFDLGRFIFGSRYLHQNASGTFRTDS